MRELRLTHVAATHVHNDYVSGGLALARRHGAASASLHPTHGFGSFCSSGRHQLSERIVEVPAGRVWVYCGSVIAQPSPPACCSVRTATWCTSTATTPMLPAPGCVPPEPPEAPYEIG